MDETRFENSSVQTEEMSAEIVRLQMGIKRTILLFIVAIMGLNYVSSAVWEIMWGYGYFYLVISLVWILMALYLFFQPRIAAKLHMRRANKFHDGIIPQTQVLFGEEELIAQSGDSKLKIPYNKLNKIKVSKNLMILTVKKYSHVTICKDGFTKGTYEEFLAFLRAKCPDLKIPE